MTYTITLTEPEMNEILDALLALEDRCLGEEGEFAHALWNRLEDLVEAAKRSAASAS